MWFFGRDPRNSDSSIWNHRFQRFSDYDQTSLRYRFFPPTNRLEVVGLDQPRRQIRSLHIHSKIHRRLRHPWGLWWYTLLVNLPWRSLIVPKRGVAYTLITNAILSRASGSVLSRAPRPVRQAVATGLRPVIERAPRLLSVRQRRQFCRIAQPVVPSSSPAPLSALVVSSGEDKWALEATLASLDESRHPIQRIVLLHTDSDELGFSIPNSVEEIDGSNVLHGLENPAGEVSIEERGQLAATLWLLDQPPEDSWLVIHSGATIAREMALVTNDGKQTLIVDSDKHYEANTLAREFWGAQAISDRWGADPAVQLIQTTWLGEMFDHSRKNALRWFEHGRAPGAREVSLSQCYVSWASKNKHSQTRFACNRNHLPSRGAGTSGAPHGSR